MGPIIGGSPVKGPADRLRRAIGVEVSALGVARLYREIAAGIVIDRLDAALVPAIEALGLAVRTTDTLMRDEKISRQVAVVALNLSKDLS